MADLLRSTVFYCGFLAIAIGLIALVFPLRRLGLGNRRRSAWLLLTGVVAVALISLITPGTTSIAQPRTHLDAFAPAFQFREFHQSHVEAPPDKVFRAIKEVTADEISLLQAFTWIRRGGQPLPASIMNAPGGTSILDTAIGGGFLLLAEDSPREIVLGTVVVRPPGLRFPGPPTPEMYRTANAPGLVKATMNFLVEVEGTGSRVITETRVFGTSPGAVRAFTPYWRAIYPGSAILRLTWLRAIKTRAEGNSI